MNRRAPVGSEDACYPAPVLASSIGDASSPVVMTPVPPNHRPPRPRLSLGRKAGAVFLLLFLALAVMAVVGGLQLRAVRLDARRFLEESQEAHLAHDLESELEQLQLLARMGGDGDSGVFARQRLFIATLQLEQIAGTERSMTDAAGLAHEADEQSRYTEIRNGLMRLTEQADRDEPLDPEILWQVQEAASAVRDETDEEVESATEDLQLRVKRLADVLAGTLVVGMLGIASAYLLTRRHVVRPLEELRRGARSFGAGELDRRMNIRSRDEIGELADEFNRMADNLTGTQRDLERRVRERTAELIRAARLADLGTFAAGIAHEVNTPLASIASCAEGLERRIRSGAATREEQLGYLQTIAHEAYRAHDITARLLALARQEPGETAPLDLRGVIGNVARLLDHELRRRGLTLRVELDAATPLARANAAEMEQLLLNLIKNASDVSPSGGTITLRSRGVADRVVVEVEDQGPGIPEERRALVFEPFFTTKKPGEGTGLGLSIVQSIVKSHHGSIEVDAGSGGGALFRVGLPAVGAEPGEAA